MQLCRIGERRKKPYQPSRPGYAFFAGAAAVAGALSHAGVATAVALHPYSMVREEVSLLRLQLS